MALYNGKRKVGWRAYPRGKNGKKYVAQPAKLSYLQQEIKNFDTKCKNATVEDNSKSD